MSLVVKPYTFSAGSVIIAAEHNSNFDTLYNDYNGNIGNANIVANASINLSKLSLSDDVAFTGDVNFNNSATTHDVVDIQADSLTTASALHISSASASTAARALALVENTTATATSCVGVKINCVAGPHMRLAGNPSTLGTPGSVGTATIGDFWFDGTNFYICMDDGS